MSFDVVISLRPHLGTHRRCPALARSLCQCLGPSLASSSTAIAAAAVAEAVARQEREEQAQLRREEALGPAMLCPLSIALGDPSRRPPQPM
jgi:hypothetical protein